MERNAGLEPVPPVWKTGMLAIEHQFRKYHILPTSYFTLVPMGPRTPTAFLPYPSPNRICNRL